MEEIDELFADADVVGTYDVAEALDVDPNFVRDWAFENGVSRVGTAYAFTYEDATALLGAIDDDSCAADEDDDEDGADEDDGDGDGDGDGDDGDGDGEDDDE